MLSVLSDQQKVIVETITMRFHIKEALSYLAEHGYPISVSTYTRQKRKIENMKMERLQHIALHFTDKHLEFIDKQETIEKLMWQNYHAAKDPAKKVQILETICRLQFHLAAFYDTTRYVLEKNWKTPIFKVKEPYLSINVEHEVNKEADERARKLRSEMIRQRQIEVDTPALPSPEPESSPATNNDEVTFASLDTDTAVEEQQKCS